MASNEISLPKVELIDALGNQDMWDAVAEVGDIAFDKLIDEGVLDGVPIAGPLIALFRAGRTISSKLYAKKVLTFLREIGPMTRKERQAFSDRLDASGETGRFTEAVFLFLEKADEMGKPAILGRIVAQFVQGEFSLDDCQRLCLSVNRAYSSDLQLLKNFEDGVQIDVERAEALFSAGLLSNAGFDGGGANQEMAPGGTIFVLNRFGELLAPLV